MIHTYPQSEINIIIQDEKYACEYSPEWEAMPSQKRHPSKSDLWDVFQYHTDGYLIRKSTGTKTKTPINPDTYRAITFKGVTYREHKCIAIMHLPEGIETFEELPYEPVYELGILVGWSKLIVDHIKEGNKRDNRIENLQIISNISNWWKAGFQFMPPWIKPKHKYDPNRYQQSLQKDKELFYKSVNQQEKRELNRPASKSATVKTKRTN
jgi:hypothetical protein